MQLLVTFSKMLAGKKLYYPVFILSPAARWTCRRWRNTSIVGEMLDELEWPSFEACRDRFSLLLFHKIRSGAVSIQFVFYSLRFAENMLNMS